MRRPGAVLSRLAATVGVATMWAVAVVPGSAGAQVTVWRCPGPPVLYTDRLPPSQAQAAGCAPLAELPVAVGSGAPLREAPRSTAPGSDMRHAPASGDAQRQAQAIRILQAELEREEARLSSLRAQPTASAADVRRIEADIEALRRELARRR